MLIGSGDAAASRGEIDREKSARSVSGRVVLALLAKSDAWARRYGTGALYIRWPLVRQFREVEFYGDGGVYRGRVVLSFRLVRSGFGWLWDH